MRWFHRTAEQIFDLQLTAPRAAGAAWTFADNGVSGFTVERPQVSKARDRVETGDVLTVWKLDRLGRNTRQFLDIIEIIRERGAGFRGLTEGLDTTGLMGTAMPAVMAAFGQLERHDDRMNPGGPRTQETFSEIESMSIGPHRPALTQGSVDGTPARSDRSGIKECTLWHNALLL